jgi:hypothetical protein
MQAPGMLIEAPPVSEARAGVGAGGGVEVEEPSAEATRAADLLLLSAANQFLILIPSFLRIWHFAMGCFFS